MERLLLTDKRQTASVYNATFVSLKSSHRSDWVQPVRGDHRRGTVHGLIGAFIQGTFVSGVIDISHHSHTGGENSGRIHIVPQSRYCQCKKARPLTKPGFLHSSHRTASTKITSSRRVRLCLSFAVRRLRPEDLEAASNIGRIPS